MAALPGVTGAVLNTTTGKLKVSGEADLEAIRRLGKAENYAIQPAAEGRPNEAAELQGQQAAGRRTDWTLLRTILAGVAAAAAYGLEGAGAPGPWVIALYLTAIVAGAWGNARKAAYSLPRLDFNMAVLMTIAVTGAALIGEWAEGAVVAFLYSVSELLEASTMERARRSIGELMDIAPRVATIRRGETEVEVPVEEVQVGDRIIIRPGEKIAMDGRVIDGHSAVDQAAITGESVPVEKEPGDEVFAGTVNAQGALEIEVTRRVEDTTIARIIHLVEEAQTKRAPSQAFVDRFAAVYTPIVMALAIGIGLVPPLFFGADWGPWIYRGLALLVVACPCALVVSTPVSVVSAIANAARHGVLVKGGIHLEEMGAIAAVAFDKTGTLTLGRPAVTDVIPGPGSSEEQLLRLAASVEARSEHPLARAITQAAIERQLNLFAVKEFVALGGRGARGILPEGEVYVGNLRLFREMGLNTSPVEGEVNSLQKEGKTAMVVGTQQRFLGVIGVADQVRETSRAAMAALKQEGVKKTVMLTGDNWATARAMGRRVGVDEVRAELLPEDKVEAVQDLLRLHGKVAMVGDGINDAPALATATVGVAMGGAGTDTVLETADIVLMADDLSKLPFTVRLSRAALGVIRQNIAFSIGIKVLAVLLVFPGWLTLWLAILADMGASVLVTLNGIRLLGLKPDR